MLYVFIHNIKEIFFEGDIVCSLFENIDQSIVLRVLVDGIDDGERELVDETSQNRNTLPSVISSQKLFCC